MALELRASGTNLAELKRAAQLPAGVIDETIERDRVASGLAIASGTLYCMGLVVVRAGQPVTAIGTRTATVLVTAPTNQWMCLVRQSDLSVLAKTQDKTTEAWGANVDKSFTVTGGPYTPGADTLAYLGLVLVHSPATGTVWASGSGQAGPMGLTPIKAATSTTGLTDPASLGATAGALTSILNILRGWYS